jgi:hypothetical protein
MGLVRRIFGLLASLAVAAGIHPAFAEDACVQPPGIADLQQAVKFPPRDRGFLWLLEKGGRVSWLYGTIHVGRLEWLVPGPVVMSALRGSDAAVFELDLTKTEELAGLLPQADPVSAARVLAGGLGARLDAELKKACVPDAARSLRPAMQAFTLTAVASRAAGLHPELGSDLLLTGIASRLSKRIVGLEAVADQMKALMPASDEEEREMVLGTLDQLDHDRARKMMARMASAWERGDANEMATYTEWCDCLDTEADRAMLRRLTDDRNPPMADKLAALHASGTKFFAAVGALHMTGKTSLLTLLRAKGFTVRQIPFERN